MYQTKNSTKNLFGKTVSLLIAVIMIFGMVPVLTLSAKAVTVSDAAGLQAALSGTDTVIELTGDINLNGTELTWAADRSITIRSNVVGTKRTINQNTADKFAFRINNPTSTAAIMMSFEHIIVDGTGSDGTPTGGGLLIDCRNFTIFGLTVQHCGPNTALDGGSAIYFQAYNTLPSNVTLQNSRILENVTKQGAVYIAGTNVYGETTLNIIACVFNKNMATSDPGSGLATFRCVAVNISNSSFTENSAPNGGAIFADAVEMNIVDSTLENNVALSGYGGAIVLHNPPLTTLNISGNTTISGNTAGTSGGGIHGCGVITISNSTKIENNSAALDGGGIYVSDGKLFVTGGSFENNSANNGGAISALYDVSVSGTAVIKNNTAAVHGGGIHAPLSTLTVGAGVLFSNNGAVASFERSASDVALYSSRISATNWTLPFTNGYNNYDIAYQSLKASFNSNGGDAVAYQVIPSTGGQILEPTPPTKPLNTFQGWYSDAELTTPWVFTTAITGDKTLYAKWQSVGGAAKIVWIGVPYLGDDYSVKLSEKEILGVDGTSESIDHDQEFDAGSTWLLDTDRSPAARTVTYSILDPQTYYFYYDEDADGDGIADRLQTVTITVKGVVDNGGSETMLWSYPLTVRGGSAPKSVDSWAWKGYRLADGEPATKTANPALAIGGLLDVKFEYVDNTTDVTIYAKDYNTGENVIGPIVVNGVECGTTFNYDSMSLPTYQLVNGSGAIASPYAQTLNPVSDTNNTITFQYKPAKGNVTVIYRDPDTSEEIGRSTVEVTIGVEATIPKIAIPNYTATSGAETKITWDGTAALTPVEYTYTKNTQTMKFVAYNKITGAVITGKEVTSSAKRVMENHDFTSDIAALTTAVGTDYDRAALSSLTFFVDAIAANNTVKIYYEPKRNNQVTVNIYDATNGNAILQTYKIPAATGETIAVTPSAIVIPGYEYDSANAGNVLSAVCDGSNSLSVYMKDVRKTLTINTKLGLAGASVYATQKYVVNDSDTILAPYVNGHVLTGYQINTSTPMDADGSFAGVPLTMTADMAVTFIYKSVEDVIIDGYVTLTVKGSNGTSDLYSYNVLVPKSADTTITASNIPSYVLDTARTENYSDGTLGGTPGQRVVNLSANGTHTFYYKKNTASVTVDFIDEATSATISGKSVQTVSGIIGESITVNAPVIADYELITTETATKNHTVTGVAATDKITFTYKKSSGNVLFQYVSDIDGTVLAQVSEAKVIGTATSGMTPSPLPSIPTGWVMKSGTGTPSYSGAIVLANTVITFTLVKDMKDITVNYYKHGTTTTVATSTTQAAQNGAVDVSVFAAPADLAADNVLVGAPYQTVALVDGTNVINFYYQEKTATGAGAVTIIGLDQDGNVISYSVGSEKATGSAYTTTETAAPTLTGWKTPVLQAGSDPTSGVMTELGVKVIYKYSADTISVKTYIEDISGNAIAAVAYENSAIRLYQTSTAQKGEDMTVYAPHVPGYVLTTASSKAFTNLAADESATFTYKMVQDYVDENFVKVTVKGTVNGTSTELYSYDTLRQKDSGTYSVDALPVNGYVLIGGATATVTVVNDDVVHEFKYNSLESSVLIKLVDASNTVMSSFRAAAKAGDAFSYYAPNVPGYYLTGSALGTVAAVLPGGASEIEFEYDTIASNVTIIAKENNATGAVIGVFEVASPTVGTQNYASPDLTSSFYTAKAANVEITYDGTNSVSVEAYYTKDLVSVPVKAVDYLTNSDIASPAPLANQRKGEAVAVNALSVTNYVLVSATPVVVLADGTTQATFKYRTQAADEVVVRAIDDQGNLLQSYILQGTVGETVTAKPPVILGWKTTNADGSAVVGTNSEIVFNYTKDVVTVTIKNDANSDQVVVEVASGGSYTAHAPHIPGYVAYGETSKEFNSISSNQEVTFTYKTLDDAADEHYITLTVQGMTGSTRHYSYTMRVAKSDTPITLTYPAELFAVNGYVLADGQDFEITPNADATLTAEYVLNMTTVTIKAVYDDGVYSTPVETFTTVTVPAEIGKTFYYNAPSIAGFNNTGSTTNPITPTGTSDQITFYYTKASGNLTVIAIEGGTEFGRFVRPIAIGAVDKTDASAPTATEIPAISNYEFVANSGVASHASYDGVNDVTLTYEYTRKATSLQLVAYSTLNNAKIPDKVVTVDNLRIFENYDYASDIIQSIPGYSLIPQGSTTILVDENSANNVVKVYYTPAKSGSVPVEVRVGSQTGTMLHRYSIYAAPGETVTLKASEIPAIPGYTSNSAASILSAKEGTSDKIIVVLRDIRFSINVYTTKDGQTPVLHDTLKIIPGGSAQVYAPVVPGYALDSVDRNGDLETITDSFTCVEFMSVVGNYTVTFNYKTVTFVGNKSAQPVVNLIEADDARITGSGTPNAVITVTLPDGSKIPTTVDSDGNWFVDVPAGSPLKIGELVKAVQTEDGKAPSDEIIARVANKHQTSTATVDPIMEGDDKVTGTGVPGAEVTVTLPNGTKLTTPVDPDGNWEVTLPASYDPKVGDEIKVVQTEDGKDPSGEVLVTVGGDEQSTTPTVDPVMEGDDKVSGTGVPGADVTVTLPDGTKITEEVKPNGTWEIDIPAGKKPSGGDTLTVVQTEDGKKPSGPVLAPVGYTAQTETPTVNPIIDGDTEILGTGVPGAEIIATLPNGSEITTQVDPDGNWKLDIPAGMEPKAGEEVSIIQIEGDKDPSGQVLVVTGHKEQTETPTVDPVTTGDNTVSGTGVPDAVVVVTLPDGSEVSITVEPDGTWEIDIPAGKEPVAGDQIKVVQTESGKDPSGQVLVTTGDGSQSNNATVDPVTEGDDKITGTGEPDAEITVTLPDGSEITTTVEPDGTWEIDLPNEPKPAEGDRITIVQKEDGKDPSGEVVVEVGRGEVTKAPVIDPVTEGDSTIGGMGIPDAVVTVTLPDGAELTATVDQDGNWTVNLPANSQIEAGDSITVTQKEDGKKTSPEVTVEIGRGEQTQAPTVDPINQGDETASGTGVPGANITVTLPDGTDVTTKIKPDGTWEVDLPAQPKLNPGDQIDITQTEENKRPSPPVVVEVGNGEQTQTATVDPITEGDDKITGTGVPGAEITVTLPDGTEITTNVNPNGTWEIDVPAGLELKPGDRVTAVQKEDGKSPSGSVVVEIGRKTAGTITITVTKASTGAVLAGATVKVTLNSITNNYTTDSNGKVVIPNAEFGSYTITASFTGHSANSKNIALSANNTSQNVAIALNVSSGDGGGSGGGGGNFTETAKLTVRGIDKDTGKVVYEQASTVTVGQSRVVTAPAVADYTLDPRTPSPQTIVIKTGENMVTFYYNYSAGNQNNNQNTNQSGTHIGMLETDLHIPYIKGYEDGTVRPDNNITRAEVAVIFFRLLKGTDKNALIGGRFGDVNNREWYAQAVNYLASIGVLNGYEDGNFRPGQPITRAELVAIVSRFDELETTGNVSFTDVAGHWAERYITSAAAKGWISGFGNGAFEPDAKTTRAQTITVINNVLNRKIHKRDIPAYLYNEFSDLSSSHWAFEAIIEASIDHEYTRGNDGYEIWE